MRPIVNVSDWPIVGYEQMGSKPKRWLLDRRGVRWLFKEVTTNKRQNGGVYLRGDDWSEVVSSDVARALGLATATVELAAAQEVRGVLSRTVAVRAGLVHGNEVLSGRDSEYASRTRLNPRYTVAAAMDIMSDVEPPPNMFVTAPVAFAGYLVLDALIGNTDRHHENWALLKRFGSPRQLAPSFDHASSLGFLLSDEERHERLTSLDMNRTVQAYVSRATTPFSGASSPLDAAMQAVIRIPVSARRGWQSAVADVGGVLVS